MGQKYRKAHQDRINQEMLERFQAEREETCPEYVKTIDTVALLQTKAYESGHFTYRESGEPMDGYAEVGGVFIYPHNGEFNGEQILGRVRAYVDERGTVTVVEGEDSVEFNRDRFLRAVSPTELEGFLAAARTRHVMGKASSTAITRVMNLVNDPTSQAALAAERSAKGLDECGYPIGEKVVDLNSRRHPYIEPIVA